MAVMGSLGSVIFTVSDKTVRTLSAWKWSGSARYAVHNRHMGNALTEFTGLDPDKITFDIQMFGELGVDPMAEITQLWNYLRKGTPVPLTVGTHCYGRYRWNIVSLDVDIKYTDKYGDLAGAVATVSLQEYLRTDQTIPGAWAYK